MATQEVDAGKMTIWQHLEELRSRLIRGIIGYGIGVLVAWEYRDPILAWLWKPFAQSWREQNIPGEPALNFAAPSDAFKAYFKMSMIAGLLFAAPIIFYQLWSFIAPGLYKKEKKLVIPFVVMSTVLFVGGGLFGWRVAFPATFGYFLELAGGAHGSGVELRPTVMIGQYLDFVGQMLLGFGIVFEVPVLILCLSIAGVVNYLQLIAFWRWFVLLAFIVGAIVTPPDVMSQLAMSLPLCVLYFLSIGLAYFFGKRPSKEAIEKRKADRAAKKARNLAARKAKSAAKR
jgi:sec-independent protein translocase protein TatC